jgi:hypothetical protein
MSDPVLLLLEKDRITDLINQLFIATDKRDWPAARRCFAEAVLFDMTSLAGGAPSRVTPEQIAAGWEEGLRPIEAVHHQAGNYRVDVRGTRPRPSAMASHPTIARLAQAETPGCSSAATTSTCSEWMGDGRSTAFGST